MEPAMKRKAAAHLTAAVTGKSAPIESLKTITDIWYELARRIEVGSESDYLAAVLATGRVWDLHADISSVDEILRIHELVKEEFGRRKLVLGADDRSVVSSHLAAAYITITPAVESVGDMVDIFDKFMENVDIGSELDVLAGLLVQGRMHDSKNKIEPEQVPAIMARMKELLKGSGSYKDLS